MTRFLDGPAAGATLMLKRAPLFLRVTKSAGPDKSASGNFDALDRLEDEPTKDEKLFAYRRVGAAGGCFIDGRGISGFYAIAEYQACAEQPDDATMRDRARWQEWCLARSRTISEGK